MCSGIMFLIVCEKNLTKTKTDTEKLLLNYWFDMFKNSKREAGDFLPLEISLNTILYKFKQNIFMVGSYY